jgi:hypothetical protein
LLSKLEQEIAMTFGGKVDAHTHREYGFAKIQVKKTGNELADRLFDGIDVGPDGMQVRIAGAAIAGGFPDDPLSIGLDVPR